MILIALLISLETQTTIDSLKAHVAVHPQFSTVIALNNAYLARGDFENASAVLRTYEPHAQFAELPVLAFMRAQNYFFGGRILTARDEYMALLTRYTGADIANDALEMLYLIESTQKDTVILKRLAHALYLYHTDQLSAAEESLKGLTRTSSGAYAYYYMALVYKKQDDVPQALSALHTLEREFPGHTLHNAALLHAELCIVSRATDEAQRILEDLLVRAPTTIYAARARKMLREMQK
jgi:tetratricopeptide (TPR) repeat protein